MIDYKQIKAVAFDCDGVMFDSSQANQAYYNKLLAHIGQPQMNAEQYAFAHMHTVEESLEYLIPDPELLAAARDYRKTMRYISFVRYMVVEPHLKALLARLRPAFKTAVATNRTDTMDRVLYEHDLEGQFDIVITASDVAFPKPHPEQLNVILAHFGLEPHQMIFIGDSSLDSQAAQAAEVPFIAFGNGDLPADIHIQRLDRVGELLELV